MRVLPFLALMPVVILTSCANKNPVEEFKAKDAAQTTNMPSQNMPLIAPQTKGKTASVSPSKITTFNLSGAIAARNKNKGWSASINWAQQGVNHYQIRLMGPLGGGTVLVNRQGGVVTYKEGAKSYSSSNADELLQKHTGIRLPVNSLYYWVRGLPAPGNVVSKQQDPYNHLSQLQQGGYTINYERYTSVNGTDLPSLIRLQGQGTTIKLVIKHW